MIQKKKGGNQKRASFPKAGKQNNKKNQKKQQLKRKKDEDSDDDENYIDTVVCELKNPILLFISKIFIIFDNFSISKKIRMKIKNSKLLSMLPNQNLKIMTESPFLPRIYSKELNSLLMNLWMF